MTSRATVLIAVLLGVAALHVARPVLIPLALAVLLAFVLGPVVAALERRISRVGAVALVAVVLWSGVGVVAWVVAAQVSAFARELPQYRAQLKQRVGELRRATAAPGVSELQTTVDELLIEIGAGGDTTRVVVQGPTPPFTPLSTAARLAASAGLVTLLLVFILLERQELRNRLIRLAGHGRLALTTRAMDEASRRISRYLTSQAVLNLTFGASATVGLFAIGVPYALGWGVLAGVLRFIPFVGFWIALVLPALFSIATSQGWLQPALTVALYLGLALVMTFGLEPLLYGQSAGVSRVALLVGMALWTWLWGPVGLVIATPLTVCLIVLGRHVPELRYIAVLIGDEPVLAPPVRFYQRLLAGDHEEAADIVEQYLASHPAEQIHDDLLLPALGAAKADRMRGAVDAADARVILRATDRMVRELEGVAADPGSGRREGSAVLAFPAQDDFDELALRMVRLGLAGVAGDFEIASPELLSSEAVALAAARRARIVILGSLQPGGHARLRALCKRLRRDLPGVTIVAAALTGRGRLEAERDSLVRAGADAVVTGAQEAREQLLPLVQHVQASSPAPFLQRSA